MRRLELKFGKKHPALEDFNPPPEQFGWLVQAYFRLHRRRQHSDMGGAKPLSFLELSIFSSKVLRLDGSLEPLFYRCMEATDNAVLYDQYVKAAKQRAAEEETTKPGRSRRSRP